MNDETRAAELASGAAPVTLAPVRSLEAGGATEEQLAYAHLLDRGMKIGLLSLVVTFVVYMTGLLPPHVPVADLPRVWAMPVKGYLAATGSIAGWGWLRMLDKGDFLNFVAIAFLSGVTIACYLAVLPVFLRKRDRAYAALSVAEVLVLALAASGLLAVGGH